MNVISGVYSITSPSGGQYIGSSKDIHSRWRQHKWMLEEGLHHSSALQNAWSKYSGNLEYTILETCQPSKLAKTEQKYLDKLKPEYNMLSTAYSFSGYSFDSATKDKMKDSKREVSQDTRDKISKANMGHVVSAETRLKISLANKRNQVSDSNDTRKITYNRKRKLNNKADYGKIGGISQELYEYLKSKGNTYAREIDEKINKGS